MKLKFKFQMQTTKRQSERNGFTLLEVMVALAVMAIVLVSVYRMHSQSLTLNMAARFHTQAPLLAQGKLAELETTRPEDWIGGSGDFGEDFPGYNWTLAVEDVASEALGEISEDLKKIDVTVSFNNDEFVHRLRTYRLVR